MVDMAAVPGSWVSGGELAGAELAGAELAEPAELAACDAALEDCAAFTVPGLSEWGFARPARKATAPTATSTTTATIAIGQASRR
jgi:hypothetical protein